MDSLDGVLLSLPEPQDSLLDFLQQILLKFCQVNTPTQLSIIFHNVYFKDTPLLLRPKSLLLYFHFFLIVSGVLDISWIVLVLAENT